MTALLGATKFGRSYRMSITGKSNKTLVPNIAIGFPITLELDITHNIFAAANVANFSLYNLSATNRSEISFSTYLKPKPYPIILEAGYISQQSSAPSGDSSSSLPVIFNGFANVAFTERAGPNLITRINAFDNGDITSNLPPVSFGPENAYTAPIGTPFKVMALEVMKRLAPNGVRTGKVILGPKDTPGPVTGIPRPFSGRVWENLETLAAEANGAHLFIENGICNILGQLSVLPVANSLGILQSSTGLLGIPKFTDSTIICSMIFEPSLTIGAQIELNSTYNPGSNGLCKIVSYSHHGTISGVESQSLITDVTLMRLNTPLGAAS